MDDAIGSIRQRRWDIISSLWHRYLPDKLDELPNAYETPANDELLRDRMRTVASRDQFETIADAPRIRTLVFEAARFCAERCLYVTRTAEKLASNGTPTAAMTLSYLGMVFGSRSIQSFLGVYYCFREDLTWLIDIWPHASAVSSQGRQLDWEPQLSGLISNMRIGHEHHWKIFIRLYSVATRLPLSANAISILRRHKDPRSFSTHRNEIHYNDIWPYSDLYRLLIDPKIGLITEDSMVDEDELDHNLKLAQIVAFWSAHMLLDILAPLPKFRAYCAETRLRMSADWHPLMNAGAMGEAIARL